MNETQELDEENAKLLFLSEVILFIMFLAFGVVEWWMFCLLCIEKTEDHVDRRRQRTRHERIVVEEDDDSWVSAVSQNLSTRNTNVT